MKKIILSICCLILFFSGVFSVYAGTESKSQQVVNYELPYPGMLINHPFYFFKQTRDAIVDYFLRNPVKRVEFHILQSDKFLAMAIQLAQTKDYGALQKSLNYSSRYMNQSIVDIRQLKKQSDSYPSHLRERLIKSIAKHLEIDRTVFTPIAQISSSISEDINTYRMYEKQAEELFGP